MTVPPTIGARACVFDAYGTLFDVRSTVKAHPDLAPDLAETLAGLWREKQLQYTWLRSLQDRYADFSEITGEALDFAIAALSISKPGLRDDLLQRFHKLEAFPDAIDALAALAKAGARLAILSNGTPAMLDSLLAKSDLASMFEVVISVDDVRVYKPHPRVYALACSRLGLPACDIAFISSNGWDAAGAASYGFSTIWCNRGGSQSERLPGTPKLQIGSLAELPAVISLP